MAAQTDDVLRRVPPQNIEAEQSVLGAVLLENEAINQALEILTADDFYRETHREIFRAMMDLSDHNQPVDAITLTDALRTKGVLEQIGGPALHRGTGRFGADRRQRRALRAHRARKGGAAQPRDDRHRYRVERV